MKPLTCMMVLLLQNWAGPNWDNAAVWIWQLGNCPKNSFPEWGWLILAAADKQRRKRTEMMTVKYKEKTRLQRVIYIIKKSIELKATCSNGLFCPTKSPKPKGIQFKMISYREKQHNWDDDSAECLHYYLINGVIEFPAMSNPHLATSAEHCQDY